jgi:peptide-methionine (S)-S-oxide reductase
VRLRFDTAPESANTVSIKTFQIEVSRQMREIVQSIRAPINERCHSPFAWLLAGMLLITASLLPRNVNGQIHESNSSAVPADGSTAEPIAVLAGGCFWGVDGVFKHVKGVTGVTSGYAGGVADTAQYETVSTGTTGHAESVEITYDPSKISYSQLLKIFFFVAHDPTELNRQGPDEGTQYRSVIFYANDAQKRTAENYVEQLTQTKAFTDPIVTQVVPLKGFYPAENYHQNFLERNPDNPYIVFNDLPKLAELRKQFPALYTPTPGGQ